MGLLEELSKVGVNGVLEDQARVPHAHLTDLKMFRTGEALMCGSEYFIAFNDEFTLGFTRDDLIQFRDAINEGIRKSLAATEAPVTTPCFLCNGDTLPDNAFQTSIGWMHFECKEVHGADSQSATPGA